MKETKFYKLIYHLGIFNVLNPIFCSGTERLYEFLSWEFLHTFTYRQRLQYLEDAYLAIRMNLKKPPWLSAFWQGGRKYFLCFPPLQRLPGPKLRCRVASPHMDDSHRNEKETNRNKDKKINLIMSIYKIKF